MKARRWAVQQRGAGWPRRPHGAPKRRLLSPVLGRPSLVNGIAAWESRPRRAGQGEPFINQPWPPPEGAGQLTEPAALPPAPAPTAPPRRWARWRWTRPRCGGWALRRHPAEGRLDTRLRPPPWRPRSRQWRRARWTWAAGRGARRWACPRRCQPLSRCLAGSGCSGRPSWRGRRPQTGLRGEAAAGREGTGLWRGMGVG